MFLKKRNINCTVHYIPANKHLFYKNKFKKFKLKNSDYVFNNILSIPFHNNLNTSDIIFVSKEIKKFLNK
jgi:dTDP-4-amino-4,6-dideoxygalactose transaminase